jgi:general nucleoside transport system ATP-binding protein
MLVPSQTVTENILLGLDEPRFRMNLNFYDQKIAELGKRFGMEVDPKAKIWQLSVGEQQRVEILKMLYRGAQVLIMDEPTAVLAPQETEVLFNTLRTMVAEGKSVIFISHKLQEVMAIADRVTVLRKGRVTATGVKTAGSTRQELARLMVGRDVVFQLEKNQQEAKEIVLQVEDVYAENDKGLPAVRGMSFEIRQGEIYGLAGVAGNGQRELSQIISGLRKCTKGRILLNGVEINNHPAHYAIQRGLAYVPEDRTHVGSAPNLSVTDNVIMKNYRHAPISHGWLLDTPAAQLFAKGLKEAYNIVVPTVDTPVRLLSGGNLQRVILAREISGHPSLLVAVQPTRGLDVGAIEGVHRLLLAQREAGAAILLISEELEELLALSDRVAVIYEGQLMGEVRNPEIETVGLMMTGTPLTQIATQTATGAEHHG